MSPRTQLSPETEALSAALTELAARAGHDMVGPLNQAGSLLALFIKRYRGKLDTDAEQLLDFLLSASTRMEGVIEGVQQYMEAVGRMPELTTVDLNLALTSAKERLEKKISDSGASIKADRLPAARADRDHIVFIFEQLLDNALKFRASGEAPNITISNRAEGELITIAVADQGIGISPEQRNAIFLPFKRLNGREYRGPGLGLAAVKALVEMNRGAIALGEPIQPAKTALEFTLRRA